MSGKRDNMLGHNSFGAKNAPPSLSGLSGSGGFAVNLALDGLDANSQCRWHRQIAALGMTRAC